MRISDWSSDVCSHKLSRARLRRVRSSLVGNKPKLPRDRRLDAGAIQNLTLDGRAINHFLRNELDHDPLPGIAVEMVHRSDDDTGTLEESLLGLPQQRRVEAESGPVGELPIPAPDRLSAFLSIMLSTNRDLISEERRAGKKCVRTCRTP